jgi:hypothetical protein
MPRSQAMSGTTATVGLPFFQASATVIPTLVIATVVSMRGLGPDSPRIDRPWLIISVGIQLTFLPLAAELLCLVELAKGHPGRLSGLSAFVVLTSIAMLFAFILNWSLRHALERLSDLAQNLVITSTNTVSTMAVIITWKAML